MGAELADERLSACLSTNPSRPLPGIATRYGRGGHCIRSEISETHGAMSLRRKRHIERRYGEQAIGQGPRFGPLSFERKPSPRELPKLSKGAVIPRKTLTLGTAKTVKRPVPIAVRLGTTLLGALAARGRSSASSGEKLISLFRRPGVETGWVGAHITSSSPKIVSGAGSDFRMHASRIHVDQPA